MQKHKFLSSVFFTDSLHNIFRSYDKKVFSEIRTIRIFHHFTDKSAQNVQIRPHYYTVFPAFPQQILSGNSSNTKPGTGRSRIPFLLFVPRRCTEARAASDRFRENGWFSSLHVTVFLPHLLCKPQSFLTAAQKSRKFCFPHLHPIHHLRKFL